MNIELLFESPTPQKIQIRFKKTSSYIFKHFRVIKIKNHLFEKMSVTKSVSYILNRSCQSEIQVNN